MNVDAGEVRVTVAIVAVIALLVGIWARAMVDDHRRGELCESFGQELGTECRREGVGCVCADADGFRVIGDG